MKDEVKSEGIPLKQNVESVLKNRIQKNDSTLTAEDTTRLIHQLEIHRIELEIHNDGFNSSNQNDSNSSQNGINENGSTIYFSMTLSGKIVDLNQELVLLLGKEKDKIIGSSLFRYVSKESTPILKKFLKNVSESKAKTNCKISIPIDTTISFLRLRGFYSDVDKLCLVSAINITERKLSEKFREITSEILQVLNRTDDIQNALRIALKILRDNIGYEAVGIRLQEGQDFPYFVENGFSKDFLKSENTLFELDESGKLISDKNGNPKLVCTCGMVISGKKDESNSTPNGSWWTNNSAPLKSLQPNEDSRFRPRNHCIYQGYNSIALVPIRNSSTIIGLMQFNSLQKNRFNRTVIEYLEGIASHIGAALLRKQAEEKLRKNEKFLRTITENAPDIIVKLDRDGTILYMSRTLAGYKMEDIIGKNFCNWSLPEFHSEMKNSLAKVFEDGSSRIFESKGLGPNGELRTYRSSLASVKEDGNVEYAIMIARDITESQRSKEIIAENIRQCQSIVETTTDGFWITNLEGKLLEVNEKYCEMSGYSKDELLSMTIAELDVIDSIDVIKAKIQKIKETGEIRFETKHRRKNGEIYHVELSIQYQDFNGGQFIVFLHEITARKKAEEKLRQSEERYKSLFKNNQSVMLLINPETGKIVDANPAASAFYGWSHLELCSKNISEINVLSKNEISQEMKRAKAEESNHFFFRHRLASNEIRDVEVYSGPINFGERTLLYSLVHDITERKKAEQALLNSENKLSEIYSSMSEGLAIHKLIFDISGKAIDYTVLEVNPAYEKITGIKESDVIGQMASVLYSTNPAPYLDIYAQVEQTGIPTSFETYFPPMDKYFSISVFSPGKGRFVTVFRDITIQKKAEEALHESEFLFRESQKAAFIGSYRTDFENGTWNSSEVLDQIFGINKNYPRNVEGWLDIVYPDDREMMNTYLIEEVINKGLAFNKEYRIIRKNDNELRWVHCLGQLEYDSGHVVKSLVGTIQDITERKLKEEALRKLNQALAALSKSSQAMSKFENEDDYLKHVCQIVVEDTDFAMVWIGYAENDADKSISVKASAGFEDNYLESIKLTWNDSEYGNGPTGKAIKTGEISVCNNMQTDPAFSPWLTQATKRGFASSIVFPLKTGNEVFGAISIYSNETNAFLDDEIKLLSELANDLAHGITTIRLRKAHLLAETALAEYYSQLEETVKERTKELQVANSLLKKEIKIRKGQELNLKLAEEKYRTVADFAANWEFWIDPNNVMLYCSPSCERITGYKSSEFILDSDLVFKIVHPDDFELYMKHVTSEFKRHACDHEVQFRIIQKDGMVRWIGHFCQPVYNEFGEFKGVRGSNKDITARKKMEELLKSTNKKFNLLSENISDGIFILRNSHFEYLNKAVYRILGYENRELEGVELTKFVLPEYREDLQHLLDYNPQFNVTKNIEVECFKKDQTKISVEILFSYVSTTDVLYGVIHDITEKKQLQKNILKAIILTEENEKAYFSKELHDGLGPLLSTIKLYLQWSERPNSNKSREEIIHNATAILEEALSTVREISNKLSPHLLTNYGLSSAIKNFVQKLKETSHVNIIFESNFERRVSMEIESSLYRAVIECINNSLKHAFAKNIYIKLTDSTRQIHLQYKDDGVGYDLEDILSKQKGLGLFNLQNRIQTIGGKLIMNSRIGLGVDYLFAVDV